MITRNQLLYLLINLTFLSSCKGQNPTDPTGSDVYDLWSERSPVPELLQRDTLYVKNAPSGISRNIMQDKAGDMWFATFEGVLRYDGTSFTHMTKDVTQSRFFSLLEDSNGTLWFGTIGGGVYVYDGQTFQNYTTDDGLLSNEIVSIYEDRAGKIWLGANGGMSVYDGRTFTNYIFKSDTIVEDHLAIVIPNMQRPTNEVNAIIEDQSGKFWIGTRGSAFVYDGTSFNLLTLEGKPFSNIRSIIEDSNGNIWLGGNGGLWRYDGKEYEHLTKYFTGYIYEDKSGNIWTNGEGKGGWALSRYNVTVLPSTNMAVTRYITSEGMSFGIVEDADGYMWSGMLDGVYRYDGDKLEYFVRE